MIVWDIRQPMDYLDRDLNNTEYPPHRKYDGIHDDLPGTTVFFFESLVPQRFFANLLWF